MGGSRGRPWDELSSSISEPRARGSELGAPPLPPFTPRWFLVLVGPSLCLLSSSPPFLFPLLFLCLDVPSHKHTNAQTHKHTTTAAQCLVPAPPRLSAVRPHHVHTSIFSSICLYLFCKQNHLN